MNESVSLATIDRASKMLAEASSLEDIKAVHDIAQAAVEYAKAARLGAEAARHAAAVKLRAERKAGELLAGLERDGGESTQFGRPTLDAREPSPYAAALAGSGTTRQDANRWQQVAEVPANEFDSYLDKAAELTTAGLLREYVRAAQSRERENRAGQTVTVPTGTYRCIVIDPPWPVQKIAREVRPRQGVVDYPTMTVEQIAELPVGDLTADDGCHLYLWTTHKHLPNALRLFDEWGVKYQCLMTWVKNVGFTPFSWMYSTEHVLFGRVGSLDVEHKGLRLDFAAKVREHSRKPDEFYALVREASPGPRLEMFAREERDGFTTWGNETGRFS